MKPEILEFGMILLVMLAAAIQDEKTGTIPIELFGMLSVTVFAIQIACNTHDAEQALLGGGIAFCVYTLCAALFGGGGGDAIMMGALGYCMGLYPFCITAIFTSVFYMVHLYLVQRTEKTAGPLTPLSDRCRAARLPYAPSACLGTAASACVWMAVNQI